MISDVLDTLGSHIAERWGNVLSPLGLLFVAAIWAAVALGQGHALDGGLLIDRSVDRFDAWGGGSTLTLILALAALVAATAASLVADQAGALVERGWLAAWPCWWVRLGRGGKLGRLRLAKGRRARWIEADAAYRAAAAAETSSPSDLQRRGELAARRNRIALSEPQRPTWIGDRLRVVGERIHHQYGLDLEAVWPRLWLVLPDSTRAQLREAQSRFDAAAQLCGWAVLFFLLSALWWPALAFATALAAKGWSDGRRRTETMAGLIEASVDVHLSALVTAMYPPGGPMTPAQGRELTEQLRKGA